MNRYTHHHPLEAAEPAVAAFCDGELGRRRADLRRMLSRLGLRADAEQELTLLELIDLSCRRKRIAG
jgi:hypothetical protein